MIEFGPQLSQKSVRILMNLFNVLGFTYLFKVLTLNQLDVLVKISAILLGGVAA